MLGSLEVIFWNDSFTRYINKTFFLGSKLTFRYNYKNYVSVIQFAIADLQKNKILQRLGFPF